MGMRAVKSQRAMVAGARPSPSVPSTSASRGREASAGSSMSSESSLSASATLSKPRALSRFSPASGHSAGLSPR